VNDKIILDSFGQRVRFLRQQAGLSQGKLAELSNLHRTYISGVERGERNISLLNIVRLAKALGIPPSELIKEIE
jgi:transcriptional regulator with XRE-family HTH domain